MEDIKKYENMTVQEKWNMLATVANLYYNSEMTQNEIADRMYTSRSKISRMLKEARELGIVEISIKEPWERDLELEDKIRKIYGIDTIRVVAARDAVQGQREDRLPEVSAYYLDSIVKENMVVGISWGNTLYHVVKYIDANNKKNIPITVVPIMGASNVKRPERDAMDLAKDLAFAYGGTYQYIYAPLFVKNKELKESLIQDDTIEKTLQLAENADVILTSVGSIEYKSWENYLGENTFQVLGKKGAIGHIGGHFYNIHGQEIETSLSDRMIGISYEDLKKCKNVICIASGEAKAKAIAGALRGDLINTLIIDSVCGEKLIELE
ncbi:sugar-binding transcriptional regulator [Blautia sp.]|uniref:sugar-binding transcriptional regulator n=1 Tax=Blautia sp. TaxID=1955243 RepID=UPI003FD8F272